MCDYIQRELRCGHVRYIVHAWCDEYRRTHRPCKPKVTIFEFWSDRVCGSCMPRRVLIPAIDRMIRWPKASVAF